MPPAVDDASPLPRPDASSVDSSAASDGSDAYDASAGRDAHHGDDAPGDVASYDVVVPPDSSCGPLDAIANCAQCGQACDRRTGTPSCDGRTCSYVCSSGASDCNATIAPDTDGCECPTPGCCGTGCQTARSNGLGQTYYDCSPRGTYGRPDAYDACAAQTGSMGACFDQPCNNATGTFNAVCGHDTTTQQCGCWAYDGAGQGLVYSSSTCDCPLLGDSSWD